VCERIGRGKLLLRCGVLGGAKRFGAHRGRRGAEAPGISWRSPAYSCLLLSQRWVKQAQLRGMNRASPHLNSLRRFRSFQLLFGKSFRNFCAVYPLSRYANFYSLIYLLFEQHVYKHNSDVRKCVISATLKNCKLHN